MRAVILAAGKGSRISDNIGPIPKSVLEINGKPIIRRTVEMLLDRNVEVAVCTGYRHEKIEEVLSGLNVTFFNNPFYGVTNNIASLWFAKDFVRNSTCLILSADVVFEEDLLNKVLSASGDLIMVTDKSRIFDGDYFFKKDEKGLIISYGPDIPVEERDCEYVGLSKINSLCSNSFVDKLESMIDDGNVQCYFEYVFFAFIGSETVKLSTIDVAGCAWREVDRIEDYQKTKEIFSVRKDRN